MKRSRKKKKLIIHNGVFSYQYICDGKLEIFTDSFVERLAKEAGYIVERTGNGTTDCIRE